MTQRHRTRFVLALGAATALALTYAHSPAFSAKKTPVKNSEPAEKSRSEQSIVLLVNDDPVTAWEVEQRTAFLASSTRPNIDMRSRAEARWKQIIQDPKTNERFQQLLREKNVRSQEQAKAVQLAYVKQLQQNMMQQLQREVRATVLPGLRKQAKEELIEERLKLQEAKKLGIELTDDDVKEVLNNLAQGNKMTLEQFTQHLRSMGFDISTLRNRLKAQVAWREVIRRRYGAQISVNERDIERAMQNTAVESGQDTVELQVHKITLPLQNSLDQTQMARRYAEADALRRKYAGCKSMGDLVRTVGGARFDDLKYIRPTAIAEPTRSMLLAAKDGDMLPPVAAPGGIEVYAVCARRAIKADEKQQQKAAEDLRQREFEMHSRRHLLDLRQDAHIEYR